MTHVPYNLDPYWNYARQSANPYLQDWRQSDKISQYLSGAQSDYFDTGLDTNQQYNAVAGALWGANKNSNPFQEFLAQRSGRDRLAWTAQEAANTFGAAPGTTYQSPSYAEWLANRTIANTTAPQTGGYGNASVQGVADTDLNNLIRLAQTGPSGSTGGHSQAQAQLVLESILGSRMSGAARQALNNRLEGLNDQFQQEIASLGPTAPMTYYRYALQRLGVLDGMGRAPGQPGYGT